MKIKEIHIEDGNNWSYLQWTLLGLYRLAEYEGFGISIDVPYSERMYFYTFGHGRVARVAKRVISGRLRHAEVYCMYGKIVLDNGNVKTFAVDYHDSPHMYSLDALERVDAYFKMQCPITLEANAFELAPGVELPWSAFERNLDCTNTSVNARQTIDNFADYRSKIHPLMLGPRRLAESCTREALEAGYANYLRGRSISKQKHLMCYFGDSEGPVQSPDITLQDFDVDNESQLMSAYCGMIEHPNCKRAVVADLIEKMGKDCDGRVIRRGHSDSGPLGKDGSKVIPLEEFCNHIAQFNYNFNVSGYKKSIPNRFIESFIVDTAIVSDKLSVRWYEPFEAEVFETVEMGYLPNSTVDWGRVRNDIYSLSRDGQLAKNVRKAFEAKWSPEAATKYLLDVVTQS